MLPRTLLCAASVASLIFISLMSVGQGITTPRTPSPGAKVSQTIGISTVEVDYSRPSVRDREIWGKQVPYGWNVQAFGTGHSAPWRAGANENSIIRFSHPVKIEGQVVPAGDYGLFFVINADNTGEVILSKDSRSWGSFFYAQEHDQLRAKIQLKDIPFTEMLTYDFSSLSKNGAELDLNWEKKQFPVKIEYDVDAIVMANAEEELKGPVGFNWQGFSTAANYSLLNKLNMDQGMLWIDKAIAQNNSFATQSIKANLLTAMGKAEEGEKIMKENLTRATENELNLYGYQLINEGKLDKAVGIFVLNTQRFPKSPNAWDSLGECYFTKGDKKNALISFKKSMSLDPPANVRANSEKFLQQLGTN